jgi:hypothetical protein
VWLIVGLVTTAAMIAVLVGLVRHLLVLGRSLRRFQEATTPMAEEISAQADQASRRASTISDERPFGRRD